MCYVGLDAGTTGIKALAFDEKGNILKEAYREYPLITPRDGWSELDPDDIWNAAKAVLGELAKELGNRIRVIAAASCAQAVVPVDEKGKPLYRFISTVDTRTAEEDRWWRENKDENEMFRKTGLPFSPIYTVNKLLWLRKNEPDVFSRARYYFLVQDFLTWKLCGERLIDHSLASRGMMLNIHRREWENEVLQIAGISKEMLSMPVPAATPAGFIRNQVAEETGLPLHTRISVGSHDQICGSIGCGCIKPGTTTDAAGTVEVLLPITDRIPESDSLLKVHFPCIPHAVTGRYMLMSINQNSGVLLKWYRNLLTKTGDAPVSYQKLIEESRDHVADLFVLPHLNGCETPVMDPSSAAAFVRMRLHHTRADLTRAVLDAIAYDMRQQIEAFESIGIPMHEISAIGGGSKTARLLQMKADCTRRVIRTCKVQEAASLGAAILGAVSIGTFSDIPQAAEAMVHTDQTFFPQEEEGRSYDKGYEIYQKLYSALREINQFKGF